MDREDWSRVNALISMAVWEGFVSIMKAVWHKMELCDGQPDFFGFRKAYIKCPYCRQEIEAKKRVDYYNSWDRMGLGYIGPSCFK